MATPNVTLEKQPSPLGFLASLKTWQLVSIAVGIFISGYLTYVKATGVMMACVANSAFNCDKVQNSAYSMMFGIPIAYFGLATYLLLGFLILFSDRLPFLEDYGQLFILAITIGAWIFSMYLVYIQFFVLEALCPWCLAHEANFTVFLFLTIARYVRLQREVETE
jgi:uncharacterized membrane protein